MSAKPRIDVKLQVIYDHDAGLVFNQFSWFTDGYWRMELEVANRFASQNCVFPYDQDIDGKLGEASRRLREQELNSRL